MSSTAKEFRIFTDKEGRMIQAKIVKCDPRSGKVTLLRDNGTKATVPAAIFKDSDVSYIKEWMSASQFQLNSKFRIKTDLDKDKVDDKTTAITYTVQLENKTNMLIEGLRVEYAIFVRVAGFNGEKDSEKIYTGALDFDSIYHGQKKELTTAKEELKETYKAYTYQDTESDGYYSYTVTRTGQKKMTEDKISGIWLKVYGPKAGGEQIVRDFTDSRGLDEKYTWPADKFN